MHDAATRARWLLALPAAALLAGAGQGQGEQVTGMPKYPEVPEASLKGQVRTTLDSPLPTKDQLARRARNNERVKAMGLPVLAGLPVVEDEAAVVPRTAGEVVDRCLATEICAVKGEEPDRELIEDLVRRFAAGPHFSPEERTFLQAWPPSELERAKFAWRYECVHVFLWALGYLPELSPPNRLADVGKEAGIIRELGPKGFRQKARLRPLRELLDQADLYYRLHWAAIELRINGRKSPQVDEEIVMERHRALNWLIRYMGQAWDEVTTDT